MVTTLYTYRKIGNFAVIRYKGCQLKLCPARFDG